MSTTPPTRSEFGKMPDGTPVELFTLANGHGATVKLITYGARLAELRVPDRKGEAGNVLLAFDNLGQYVKPEPFFGTTVGRFANRIAGGKFTLDGVEYRLPVNNGPNTLHGGNKGFDKKVWKAEPAGDNAVRFTHFSPDGDEGFPGNLHATVTFTLGEKNDLRIDYEATCDKATPINLTNHSYFNLAGPGTGDVLGHLVMIAAEQYTPVDETLIPTGQIVPVRNTPMDFTTFHAVGERIGQVKGGYDHNYVLNKPTSRPSKSGALTLAARVRDPKTGRVMEVSTTQPGVQFYTGNFLDGSNHGLGGAYPKHGGLCLETQHFPDSVHRPNFPPVILHPGELYKEATEFRFSTE